MLPLNEDPNSVLPHTASANQGGAAHPEKTAKLPPSQPKGRRWPKVMLGLLLLLGGVELTSRVLWSQEDVLFNPEFRYLQDDYLLFWRLRPGQYPALQLSINDDGLREADSIPPLPAGEQRILLLGEDGAFGLGLPLEETFGKILERGLNQVDPSQPDVVGNSSPVRWRVINASVPGYTSWQSALYLGDKGFDLKPSIVLVYHQLVDSLPLPRGDRNHFLYLQDRTDFKVYLQRLDLSLLMSQLLHSRALLMLRKETLTRKVEALHENGFDASELPPARMTASDREMALERIRSECELRGVRLVFVKPAYRQPVLGDELLESVAQKHHLPLIDLDRERYLAPWPEAPSPFQDALTLSAAGHKLVGQALTVGLQRAGVLRPSTEESTPSTTP